MSLFSKIKEDNIPFADKIAESEQKKVLDKNRRIRRMDGATHWLKLGFDWISCIIVVVVIGTIILDLILPEHCLWLTEPQKGKLNEFFVDGSVVALIGRTFAKVMDKKDEQ